MSADPISIVTGARRDALSRAGRLAARYLRPRTLRKRDARPLVSFTFDDIPDTAARFGADVLGAAGHHGTFYVAGGLCGRTYAPWTFASGEEVRALHAAGHEIGCHTYGHDDVQRLGAAALARDLDRNRAFLGDLVPGFTPGNFAYPYGSVGPRQKWQAARRFRSARGVRQGINRGRIDLGQVLAFRLYDHLLDADGLDALLRSTVEAGGWTVFYTHDVTERPSPHGCTPGLLATAIAAARRRGCTILTVDAALDAIEAPEALGAPDTAPGAPKTAPGAGRAPA